MTSSFRLPNHPEYEAQATYEAGLHTARSRALYAKNERRRARVAERLARAEQRARDAESRPNFSRRELAKLWAAVESRREELIALEREMQGTPAGAQHRGRGSHRGIPGTRAL